MAMIESTYRIHLDITYSSTGNANTALSNINSALSALGRSETATRTSTTVTLVIEDIPTEAEAVTIRDGIKSAWSGSTRTGGKVGVARKASG